MMSPVTRDFTDEEVERFMASKLFRKYNGYRSLTDGINALREDDALYTSLVEGVKRRQSAVRSSDSIEAVLDALVEEVEDSTEFIEPPEDDVDDDEMEAPMVA